MCSLLGFIESKSVTIFCLGKLSYLQHDGTWLSAGTACWQGGFINHLKRKTSMISLIREREEPYFKNRIVGKTILVVEDQALLQQIAG